MTDAVRGAIEECRRSVANMHAEATAEAGEPAWNALGLFITDVCDFAEASLPRPVAKTTAEVPADLVELIHEIVVRHGFDEWQHGLSKAIFAALAGRIVPRGHVAVPVEDLRLAISSVQTVPRFNAVLRLKEIANGR